ncbi:hypothetical protein L1987_67937 [Smallanthus sonchifolius]|uniref:Uncharacterized protein n=1 Tax=Smallanthus sonchifolius TaxID=185202 RepID=A0ACB9B4B9_9ASTR|nr:hypothetical protein L1987_67937 [Smallanthus sonchifolius]
MVSDSCPDCMLKLELLISTSYGVNLERPYSLNETEEVVPDRNLWQMRYHPQGLLLVPHGSEDGSVVVGSHIRDHQLLGMCKWISFSLSLQGANMPARAELLLGEEEKQMFHEVYDSVLYLGIIEMLQEDCSIKDRRSGGTEM